MRVLNSVTNKLSLLQFKGYVSQGQGKLQQYTKVRRLIILLQNIQIQHHTLFKKFFQFRNYK